MKDFLRKTLIFIKWLFVALLVGVIGGTVGSLFHVAVDVVTEVREKNDFLILLLPIVGALIALLYKLCRATNGVDTNCVIEAADNERKIPFVMAPLIFVSAAISHLAGASVGREGAALQMGGSIGYSLGRILRFDKKEMHIIVMAGMSAVFAALFGTPITATVFAIEVISVGVMHYAGLVPCVVAAFSGVKIAEAFGLQPVKFNIVSPESSPVLFLQAMAIALLCAALSVLFCLSIERTAHFSKKLIKNPYIRGIAGGAVILVLTFALGTRDYNGAGMGIIDAAIGGNARPEAFILKLIFTVITIAAGFKGGEIVPTLFIGSTFGCVVAPLIGLDPSFGAALGFVALFCSVVNCPIASMMLAFEVFSGESMLIFAVVCCVSYMASGYTGLYRSQRIVYSKFDETYLNIHTK